MLCLARKHNPRCEKVSIAWDDRTKRKVEYDSITAPLTDQERVALAKTDMAFCFDTGATSHISPNRGDFTKLRSIPPKEIHGVNGLSIPTIGVV
jgi:hypothetical protein